MKKQDVYNKLPFVRGSIPVIIVGALLMCVALYKGYIGVGLFFAFFTGFIAFFFRDPERKASCSERDIISPADGKVLEVEESDDYKKVSIFMSLMDVHVNRAPVTGIVKEIRHVSGKFLRADRKEASKENEKNYVLLDMGHQFKPMIIVQIAGVIARRIVCWVREGDIVTTGQRFGMICFGSRVEVYLDKSFNILVRPGQKVKAGLTKIGEIGVINEKETKYKKDKK